MSSDKNEICIICRPRGVYFGTLCMEYIFIQIIGTFKENNLVVFRSKCLYSCFRLVLIAILYTWMFVSIYRTRQATPISSVGDFEFVIRFFFIVLTDAGCWAPIIVLKLIALNRVHIPGNRSTVTRNTQMQSVSLA